MRVAVDALSLLIPHTGIGHYTRELMRRVGAMSGVDLFFCYGLYWARELREAPAPYLDDLRRSARAAIPSVRALYGLVRQGVFSVGAWQRRIDMHHAPSFLPYRFSGPIVITVHDLSFLRYPEAHPKDRVRHLNTYLPPAIERANYVFVDSDFVRHEVLSEFNVSAQKVVTTPLGVSDRFRPMRPEETEAVMRKHRLR